MIDQFHIDHFQCLRGLTTQLTPLHALIGPNDSGKSTLLRAIQMATLFAGGDAQAANALLQGNNDEPWMTDLGLKIGEVYWRSSFTAGRGWKTTLQIGQGGGVSVLRQGDAPPAPVDFPETMNEYLRPAVIKIRDWIKRPPRLARFDPDALREPSELVPEPEIETFFVNRGRDCPAFTT